MFNGVSLNREASKQKIIDVRIFFHSRDERETRIKIILVREHCSCSTTVKQISNHLMDTRDLTTRVVIFLLFFFSSSIKMNAQ